MELYIQKSKVFDTGINEVICDYYIAERTKSWDSNQYQNYYIYILEGTGAGLLIKITSNTSDTLYFDTLSYELDTTTVYQILDFPYYRVEMFQDEKVSVTSTLQNYSDIGKLFTDYSQSFTIPASPTNNAIFSHWYDNAIDDGYDARIRYNAFIEINTIPFKNGNVQLEKANKKNGYIESYTLTFYGNLTQLKDRFGDDKLNTLDFSSLNHDLDSANIYARIITDAYEDIYYPLIGNNRKLEYLSGNSYDVTTNTGAIKWDDLFPAVTIPKIFEFIQNKYAITFTGNFLNSQQFTKLCMYMKNAELPRAYNDGVFFDQYRFSGSGGLFPEYNTTTNILTTDWNTSMFLTPRANKRIIIKFRVTPDALYTSTYYKVELYQDDIVIKTFDNLQGETLNTLLDIKQSDDADIHKYKFKISSIGNFNFKSYFTYFRHSYGGQNSTNCYNYATSGSPTGQTITSMQNVNAYVPDITVSDFFMGIVKMFNLIVTPIDATTFNLEPLELYYQSGQIKDLTPYVYADELDIEKPKLYKSINFTYEKSENILNNSFRNMFNRDYGDLIYNSVSKNESSNYEIKLPFEDVMWEKTTGYDFITATLWNKDLQTYTPKPILMYKNAVTSVPTNIKMINSLGGYHTLSQYIRFNNEVTIGGTDLGYLYSLNWGAEISSWFLTTGTNGLYSRFYQKYISNLYNQKTRVLKAKAKLEPQHLTNLKLKDRILIRDNRYIINSFTTDLTNGETTLELINDYRDLDYNSIGYRYSNIEMLNVDNTEQEVQIELYLGMFKQITITAITGFVTSALSGIVYEDTSLTILISENTSGLDRTYDIDLKYKDYDDNEVIVTIPIIQYA